MRSLRDFIADAQVLALYRSLVKCAYSLPEPSRSEVLVQVRCTFRTSPRTHLPYQLSQGRLFLQQLQQTRSLAS